jgi:ABC-type branched-subunit amino acid transport system substrate-binding protein
VTAETVKIGFLPANIGGLDAAGYALNIRKDVPQYVQALADSVNKSGGINGRKVEVAVRKTDPTSQSDQAAACAAMVNDAKVFGVVDVGALADTPAMECVAARNKTPYVHNTIWDTKWLARSGGMEVGYQAAIDRISKTWSRDLAAMGWFGKDAVVGIIGDNCAATSPVIDTVLKPDMARIAGVTKVVVAKHGCDLQSVVAQPPSFVTQFRAAGVTHVIVAAVFAAVAVFTSTAENQGYHPKYAVSDWWQATSDASAANYNPNQFDGAVGISSLGLMLPGSGKPPYPGGEKCMKAATDAGLEPMKYDGRNQELWAMCDNFLLMVDGIRTAGANPTREGWANAIQHLGSHPSVMFGPSEFHPGKVTGSDQVHTLRWLKACTCYKSVSGFRPAAA